MWMDVPSAGGLWMAPGRRGMNSSSRSVGVRLGSSQSGVGYTVDQTAIIASKGVRRRGAPAIQDPGNTLVVPSSPGLSFGLESAITWTLSDARLE